MPKEFYKLSEDVVSWHIPWAKPYVGGAVKALIIAPRGAQRETIELAQRLSMEYAYVLTLSPQELGWTPSSGPYAPANGVSNSEMIAETRAKLRDSYDVIIIGHLEWKMFPEDILYEIMKKVHDGTGLVYSYSSYGQVDRVKKMLAKGPGEDEENFVTTGIPFAALPVFQEMGAEKIVGLRQFKKGRIVTLDYGPKRPRFQYLTPAPPDDSEGYTDLHYEYYMSLVVKAVLWAANREPDILVRSWGQDGATFQRAALEKTNLSATLSGTPTPGAVQAEMTVRDASGRVMFQRSEKFTMDAPEKGISFALSALPHGRHFADLVLKRGDRVVNWATTYFDVAAPAAIASIETDRAWYEPGQTVNAKITLTAPPPPFGSEPQGRRQGSRLVVTVVDSLQREIGQAEAALGEGQAATCSFVLAHPLTISAKVRAALLQGDELLAADSKGFGIVRRKWDDFLFCVWSGADHFNERPRRLMYEQLVKAGVDTFTNSPPHDFTARRSAELGFWTIPYMTRYSYDETDLVRKPCLTDPKFLKGHLEKLEDNARMAQPFDPQGYTLGDECFLARNNVDVCFSPTCVADLREWLRSEYPSVEALNASWGTNYKGFDEAEPITLADARKEGQIPRWVDHRRHMEFVYARMMQRARDAIRKADPTGRVGFDGPFDTNSVSGNDWWRLMQVFGMCNVYFHEPDEWEYVRSFAQPCDSAPFGSEPQGRRQGRPGTLLGIWYGRYSFKEDEDYMRFFPWRVLLHGFNSVWWYAVYHGLSVCPMDAMTPSMSPYEYFMQTADEINQIKAGVGKALMNAERLDDGIGVHYSQPSLHTCTAYGVGSFVSIQRAWFEAIEDAGFQHRSVAYAQIEKSGMDPARYRVLVLPCSLAVSPEEAKAMSEFVRAGGTLLADLRPGIADQHGKLQKQGLLDELFGIKRAEGPSDLEKKVDGQLDTALGPLTAGTKFEGLTVDPGVSLAGARAFGSAEKTPIVIVNDIGKGHAILLNFSVLTHRGARKEPAAETYSALLKGLLEIAGVRPRVKIETSAGPLRMCEGVFFRDGRVEYLGFLKYRAAKDEAGQTAEVTLDGKAHTYNARTGEYLGEVDRFSANFSPDRAMLFSRLPYAVQAITVEPEKATARRGDVVNLRLGLQPSAGQPQRHWFHVQVFGPDGVERRHYAQSLPVVGGNGAGIIPLALNDASGVWRVVARDVASGVRAETKLSVE
jgi:beta-galactosidase